MNRWDEWSRQAVAEMQARNRAWVERFSVQGAPYRWDLQKAELTFSRPGDWVTADLCLIGTASRELGTFRWAWANDGIPEIAKRGLDLVRAFGARHDLRLLITPEWPGGRAEGLEMLAIAGHVQQANGGLVDEAEDLTLFFTLSQFRIRPGAATSPPGAS